MDPKLKQSLAMVDCVLATSTLKRALHFQGEHLDGEAFDNATEFLVVLHRYFQSGMDI